MQNLLISFNAVMPVFIVMLIGALCRKTGIISLEIASKINNIAYRVLTPVLLYNNIYLSGKSGISANPMLLVFCLTAILAVFGISFFAVCLFIKDNRRRGAMVQGIFRSNFVLLGLPIVLTLFPPEQTAIVSMAAAVVVPAYNILTVFALETFRGGKVNWGSTLIQIARNPLIIGTALGLATWGLGITLPGFLATAVTNISGAATPMALVALGASFQLKSLRKNLAHVGVATVCRLVLVPGLVIPVAALFGFRGVEMATMMAIFAAPTAVNSFTVAQQMDSDGPLAAEIVVATSCCCCVTIFCWIFALKQLGLL